MTKNQVRHDWRKRPVYRAMAIAPGTVVELWAESYTEEQADLESTEAPNMTKLSGMAN